MDWWSKVWRSHEVQGMSLPSASALPAAVSERSTIAVMNWSGPVRQNCGGLE